MAHETSFATRDLNVGAYLMMMGLDILTITTEPGCDRVFVYGDKLAAQGHYWDWKDRQATGNLREFMDCREALKDLADEFRSVGGDKGISIDV